MNRFVLASVAALGLAFTAVALHPEGPASDEQPMACESPTPINAECPVTGEKVTDASPKAVYRARMIAFASAEAQKEFEGWPEAKRDAFVLKHVKPGPINDLCPIGKEAVDLAEGGTTTHDGQTIGFCCPKCIAEFEKWGADKKNEYVQGFLAAKVTNTACPISEESLDADSPSVVYLGKRIGFCCKGCKRKWDLMTAATRGELLAKASKPASAPAQP
jgi:hypothetical protein